MNHEQRNMMEVYFKALKISGRFRDFRSGSEAYQRERLREAFWNDGSNKESVQEIWDFLDLGEEDYPWYT